MSYLSIARELAKGGEDYKGYRLCAIGLRADGILVWARNGASVEPTPAVHAEARLSRKLTPGSVVFVVRIRKDGSMALAKPCSSCRNVLRSCGVVEVYYSTDAFRAAKLED
jgi:hypothetical protein